MFQDCSVADSYHHLALARSMAAWSAYECKLRYKYRRRTQTITPALEESYIREDVGCGIQGCQYCPEPPPTAASLPSQPSVIAIPDGQALQQWLEVWELPDVSNWVITRSTLQQFSLKAGLRQSARLRAIYRDKRRSTFLFDDLHCAWTAHSREPTPCSTAEFYANHQQPHTPKVVVVSDQLAGVTSPEALIGLSQRLQDQIGNVQGRDGSTTSTMPAISVGASSADVSIVPSSAGSAGTVASSLQSDGRINMTVASDVTQISQHASRFTGLNTMQKPFSVMSVAEFFLTFYGSNPAVADLVTSLLHIKVSKAHAQLDKNSAQIQGTPAGQGNQQQGKTMEWQSRPFLPQHLIEEQLGAGGLLQGTVVMSRRSAEEGVVRLGASSDMVVGALLRLTGRQALGRAMHGDKVAVRLLDTVERQQQDSTAAARDTDGGNATAEAAEAGDMQLLSMGEEGDNEQDATAMIAQGGLAGLPLAEVVGVLSRDRCTLVATLAPGDEQALLSKAASGAQQRTESVLVVPYDRRYPLIRVRSRAADRLIGQRLVVQVDDWPLGSRYPEGHVVRMLGPVNDLKAESQAVLEQAGIRWQPFCQGALDELPAVPQGNPRLWQPADSERAVRRDLTGPEYFVCSIDPVGCTDVDDALHVRFLDSGLVEVGVHIADVSYFVRPNSLLDMEARDRCTSVYLVDRRLDMLPSLLSEQLCSLLQEVERYSVSVIWTLLDKGPAQPLEVQSTWFGRTIMRSRHQLHYQQAQDILDDKAPAPGDELPAGNVEVLKPALAMLKRLTDQLHAARLANGALELESLELKFKTDTADGAPTAMVPKPKIPMMDVIAEMMIWANSAVARRICDAFPGAALLRCHPPPRQQMLQQIENILDGAVKGRALDTTLSQTEESQQADIKLRSPQGFSTTLAKACQAVGKRDAAAVSLIKGLAVTAMSEAKYFSTGTAAPGTQAAYHYGLALPYYTHFTSPIRRYADVVVHRQLLAALAAVHGSATQTTSEVGLLPPQEQLHNLPPAPPMPHSELVAATARMNDQQRAAKDASTKCTELYLLLLLHKTPHVESALVLSIKEDGWMDVFVPRLQIRARMCMLGQKGIVRLPLTGDPNLDLPETDVFASAERRRYAFRCWPEQDRADVVDERTGDVIWQARVWGRVWVQLAADTSSVHGPRLSVRAVSEKHPQAVALNQLQPDKKSTSPGPILKDSTDPRMQARVSTSQQQQQQVKQLAALLPGSDVDIIAPQQRSDTQVVAAGKGGSIKTSVKKPEAHEEDLDFVHRQELLVTVIESVVVKEVSSKGLQQLQNAEAERQARRIAEKIARHEARLLAVPTTSKSRKAKWASRITELNQKLASLGLNVPV